MNNPSDSLWAHYIRTAKHVSLGPGVSGQTAWRSPSNIAIVKYWGKHGNQLPNNPSISLTLEKAYTETHLSWSYHPDGPVVDFRFEGRETPVFAEKILKLFNSFRPTFPFLEKLRLKIDSYNSFPHSSGIASSASSMSALVLCLLDMEQQISGAQLADSEWFRKASFFSRLASGSAARSVFETAALWGKTPFHSESDDAYAIGLSGIHPVFRTYRDTILIISAGTKAVSSRTGHSLMDNNPFAETRYQLAHKNTGELLRAMHTADQETFLKIAEQEALQLHALMMTSEPSFILMQPNTLEAIQRIRTYRHETGIPLCFTLDAGPNVHLLYPVAYHDAVAAFVAHELRPLCQDGHIIEDQVGKGPQRISA